jgi:hypothetical protein
MPVDGRFRRSGGRKKEWEKSFTVIGNEPKVISSLYEKVEK